MNGIVFILWTVLLQLAPVNPSIRLDDFTSVSCVRKDACFITDSLGTLYFSKDMGQTLQTRSRIPVQVEKIRFHNLLQGWVLDNKGGLWFSRDGGKSLSGVLMDLGQRLIDFEILSDGSLVVATQQSIYTLSLQGKAKEIRKLKKTIEDVVVGPGFLGAIVERRKVHYRQKTKKGSGAWSVAKDIDFPVLGALVTPSGKVVLAGCKGGVATGLISKKGLLSFARQEIPNQPMVKSVCFKPIGVTARGDVILSGLPKKLVVVSGKQHQLIATPGARQWRDAATIRGVTVLVGASGAIGWLTHPRKSYQYRQLSKEYPALVGLARIDESTIVRTAVNGQMAISSDLGLTWKDQNATSEQKIMRISHSSPTHAWAIVSFDTLVRTQDGGASYQVLGSWPDLVFRDIHFIDGQVGWVIGDGGALLKTTDGGKNWTLTKLDFTRVLKRLWFVDQLHGWIVGEKRTIFATSDGGQSWQKQLSGLGNLYSLAFFDRQNGWVAGEAGLVLVTEDGGQTWKQRSIRTDQTLFSISITDATRGIAAGSSGALFVTEDAGHHWRSIQTHTLVEITNLLCLPNNDRCLAAGQRGLLLLGDPYHKAL